MTKSEEKGVKLSFLAKLSKENSLTKYIITFIIVKKAPPPKKRKKIIIAAEYTGLGVSVHYCVTELRQGQ